MKIAFWSPLHGTGTSSGLIAMSAAVSVIYPEKTVITQTHYNLNNLERPLLGTAGTLDFFRDTGVDALIRFFKSGNITEEQVESCSIKMNEKLYLLAGTKIHNREGFENNVARNMLVHIFSCLEKYYDLVFIDTNSGDNELSMRIIDECDAVVVSLRQNRDFLDRFFESSLSDYDKVFYLFNDYDIESKYSIHNLRNLYKRMNVRNSSFIPHNADYMDAICDEKVMKYIIGNIDTDKEMANGYFFTSLKKTISIFMDFVSEIRTGRTRRDEDR